MLIFSGSLLRFGIAEKSYLKNGVDGFGFIKTPRLPRAWFSFR